MSRTILSVFLFALLIPACSPFNPSPLATPTSLPDFGEMWTIKMNHSGGIMGLSRSIDISSDGKFTVSDDRTGKSIEGQLSTNELTELRDLVRTLKPDSVPPIQETGCADCFIYTIEIKGSRSFNAQVNDVTLADSGLEPLIQFLRGIMEKSLI